MAANRILGPLCFFLYVFTVMWTLLNMLLSIINEAFSQVRAEEANKENEKEVVDFMITKFKHWSGFAAKKSAMDSKTFTYVEGMPTCCNSQNFTQLLTFMCATSLGFLPKLKLL